MQKAFPFLPLADSMFGECLLSAWIHTGYSKESLDSLIQNLSASKDGFTFTSNANKELLLSQAPSEIRSLIVKKDNKGIAELLVNITHGKFNHQTSNGLDLSFELMEWLMTGFEGEIDFTEILRSFFGGAVTITDSFVVNLRNEYGKALIQG
jgi:hypothetical protein